jgi:hypothetical protein
VRHGVRQLDHLDGARPIGEPADEAALFQRRDQAMDAGLGPQIERVLHLVEGGRHAGLLQALMDETQQLELFSGQHRYLFPTLVVSKDSPKQIMNGHYPFHMCSATI